MLALLKSETRRDINLLAAALFKFFAVQCLLCCLHFYKSFSEFDDNNLFSHKMGIILSGLALICVFLGALGAKLRIKQLLSISVGYLLIHALLGIIEDTLSLKHTFMFPKSLLRIFTLFLGAFLALFQTYCAFLLTTRMNKQKAK